jgi:hypothetical protein
MNSVLTHKQYQRLIAPRVHLWWGVGDKSLLSKEVVVEAVSLSFCFGTNAP